VRGLINKIAASVLGGAKRFAAVDFDSSRLRVVVAEPTAGGTRIRSTVSVPLPDDLDVRDPQGMGGLLARTLKDIGFRGSGVVMNVPRSQAVLKPLSLPPGTPPEEFPGMVHYQVERELPFAVDEAVIDFTVESGGSGGPDEQQEIQILVAAIRLPVVDYYRQIAEAAKVELLRLGLRPYANLCCVEAAQAGTEHGYLAVVHITADETEIDLITDGSLAFSRSAVKDMSKAGTLDEVAKTRAVGSLVAEVARSVQSYQAIERGAQVEAVLLAGETGVESQAAEQLAARLRTPCRMLETGRLFDGGEAAKVPSAFVSALGLAMEQPAGEAPPFDFLNPKRPREKKNVKRTRIAAIAMGVAVLLVVALGARSVAIGRIARRVEDLKKTNNALKNAIKAAKKDADLVAAMESWVEGGENWLDRWAHISCLLPSAKDMYLTSLKTGEDGTLRLTVQARSSETITDLNKRLEEAGYRFKPGQLKDIRDRYGYNSSTTVRITGLPSEEVDLSAIKPAPRPPDDSSPEEFVKASSHVGRPTPRRAPRRTRSPRRRR